MRTWFKWLSQRDWLAPTLAVLCNETFLCWGERWEGLLTKLRSTCMLCAVYCADGGEGSDRSVEGDQWRTWIRRKWGIGQDREPWLRTSVFWRRVSVGGHFSVILFWQLCGWVRFTVRVRFCLCMFLLCFQKYIRLKAASWRSSPLTTCGCIIWNLSTLVWGFRVVP